MGGSSKKTAKGRLDKYYHLAKEQGYRARSAFKLIQLNRKYQFLENTRVLIDLCAAPGSWLQVASKYMPISKVIIGVDLVPIKPIPGIITFASDITSDTCRSLIRKELKDWKADVVLHDGAPNVGSTWVQDAYSQAELVLMSLKLATEFLRPGGIFITKVFRSKDYNSLMWVFTQLFKKVEATKPASSRNVSAEIFVICQDFLAPKKVDPKFLDPKCVFKDIDIVSKPVNIFHPEKRTRQREGYEDGVTALFKSATAEDFIKAKDPVSFLGTYNRIDFSGPNDKMFQEAKPTTDDIQYYCQDLKLLGKKEFKSLLKWRLALISLFSLTDPTTDAESDKFKAVVEEKPLSDSEMLDQLIESDTKKTRKQKKKALLKKAKERERMKLGIDLPSNAAESSIYNDDQDLFTIKNIPNIGLLETEDMEDEEEEGELEMQEVSAADFENSQTDEESDHYAELELQIENMYERYKERIGSKKAANVAIQKAEESELSAALHEENEKISLKDDGIDSESDSESESEQDMGHQQKRKQHHTLNASLLSNAEETQEKIKKAALLFARPIFQKFEDLPEKDKENEIKDQRKGNMCKKDMEKLETSLTTEPAASGRHSKENKKVKKTKRVKFADREEEGDQHGVFNKGKHHSGVEFVKSDAIPEPEETFDESDKLKLLTPEAMTLALKLRNGDSKTRKDLIDDSFHRYAFEDRESLPSWFADEESMHNKPSIPITKEAVALLKAKIRNLQHKPTKKILEAKLRAKHKLIKKLESAKNASVSINENEELSEGQKSTQIQKLLRKAEKSKTKKKVTLVVAKGGAKGSKGRPSGVKGRYKMVDRRMKKEVKAMKRMGQNRKKNGRRK